MTKSEFAEVLSLAVSGNHTALESVFNLYMPLIDKHSVVDGKFDEDCRQYILIQIALQISHFTI